MDRRMIDKLRSRGKQTILWTYFNLIFLTPRWLNIEQEKQQQLMIYLQWVKGIQVNIHRGNLQAHITKTTSDIIKAPHLQDQVK
jgi:hypothetical protein